MQHTDSAKRLLAFGDIHGCLAELNQLLESVAPAADDQLVFLGDYIDRGPDSAGVIDRLLELRRQQPDAVFLRGNHEQMLLDFLDNGSPGHFLANGGAETIASYRQGDRWPPPPDHLDFFRNLRTLYETENFIFVHAGLRPGIALEEQDDQDLLWIRWEFLESDADWGKPVVFGHTPRQTPLLGRNRIGLDTGCVYGRQLTCCDLLSGRIWQA